MTVTVTSRRRPQLRACPALTVTCASVEARFATAAALRVLLRRLSPSPTESGPTPPAACGGPTGAAVTVTVAAAIARRPGGVLFQVP